jgi:hypothetical protein
LPRNEWPAHVFPAQKSLAKPLANSSDRFRESGIVEYLHAKDRADVRSVRQSWRSFIRSAFCLTRRCMPRGRPLTKGNRQKANRSPQQRRQPAQLRTVALRTDWLFDRHDTLLARRYNSRMRLPAVAHSVSALPCFWLSLPARGSSFPGAGSRRRTLSASRKA